MCAEFSRPSPPDVPSQWRLDASDNVDTVQRQW